MNFLLKLKERHVLLYQFYEHFRLIRYNAIYKIHKLYNYKTLAK
ncbi:hypothetical protein GAPWKB11_0991 [Gilliamella apicola]|nr:hypothetical protein GAPWKB11_0991 [Gilliamella apicola]